MLSRLLYIFRFDINKIPERERPDIRNECEIFEICVDLHIPHVAEFCEALDTLTGNQYGDPVENDQQLYQRSPDTEYDTADKKDDNTHQSFISFVRHFASSFFDPLSRERIRIRHVLLSSLIHQLSPF
jgi:hypothetical protein